MAVTTLDAIVKNYEHNEGEGFKELQRIMRSAFRRGYMKRVDLVAVCRWKSPRALPLCISNHPSTLKAVSKKVFQCKDEEERMRHLITLRGVSVPMASSILSALSPKHYGVIDIRVWQALHLHSKVSSNARGMNLRISNWLIYLKILRNYAQKYNMSARAVEQALFHYHRESIQNDRPLYEFNQTGRSIGVCRTLKNQNFKTANGRRAP